jgi:outer membrane protein assembly factor BamB
MLRYLFILIIVVFLTACSAHGPGRSLKLNDAHIAVDTVWQGSIVVNGSVKVAKGATLTILPGSEISFVRQDKDEDGLGDGTLIVEGELIAVGTRAKPIIFRSAADDPQPGDWLEIRVDFSKNVHFRYCEIRDSAHTLHAHFTKGIIEDCTIRNNIDGCRLGEATIVIRNNLFEHNQGKAINFRNATVEVTRNIIRHNGSGIFLFETDRESNIHHNNFYDNLDNIRLGDFFTGEVRVNGNWWGSVDPDEISKTIHDSRVDPEIGTVHVMPAQKWVSRTGPRDAARLQEVWEFATDGFVDASVIEVNDKLIVSSWDGNISALDKSGQVVWSRALGDVVDATPAWDGKTIYVQNWGRELFALDPTDGHDLWRFSYSPSPADDHRQGGVVVIDDLILLPAWNGILYGLEAVSGLRKWQFNVGGALRATPAVDEDRVYVTSSSGLLVAVGLNGELLWQYDFGSPLLSTPAVTAAGPIVVSRQGDLVAFDRSGRVRWQKSLAEVSFYGSPFVVDGIIYFGTTAGSLWKLNASDGKTIWRQQGFGPIYSTPRITGNRIVVGDNDGNLSIVGKDSGTVICQFRLDGDIQGVPLIRKDEFIVGGRDRNVYALRPIDLTEEKNDIH